VRMLVYISSLNVYDAKYYPWGGTVDESFPFEDQPDNRGAYSHAKLKAEEIVRSYPADGKFVIEILRPGLVYGPGHEPWLKDAGIRLGKKLVVVVGLGGRRRPLVYVDNLVDAMVLAGESKDKKGGIYNVVDGDYPTQRQFIKVYRALTKESFIVLYVPYILFFVGFWMVEKAVGLLMRKKVSLCYKLKCASGNARHSTSRIEKELGWKQTVTFEAGLASAIAAAEPNETK